MAWTTYVYDSLLITLKPGFTNNIRFAVKTFDFGNLDEIIVRPVTITGVNDKFSPSDFQITGIYPNPFSDQTKIEYMTSEHCSIKIEILNIMGQTVRVLTDVTQEPGEYEVIWNGRNSVGEKVPEGVYYVRLIINDRNCQIKKIIFYSATAIVLSSLSSEV
ncbi:MAG: T9SS type A sorting domain-containing protein [Bacteroidia bacterium]|nr:T9SS type A sorting domain-containing protein [Bacteroidia bacterium]